MRIIILLLIGVAFQAQADSYAQSTRISVSLKNAPVEEVLNSIEEKSEFYFLYNSKLVDVDRKVDVQVENSPVYAVLDRVFEGTDVKYRVDNRQIILMPQSMSVEQAGRRITGKVSDADGEPIIGASVIEKGTTNGVATDVDGNFSLNVGENAVLQISFLGYVAQEIEVGNRQSVNVTLVEDIAMLDEVVVVGYGTVKKTNLTGAVGYIDGKELENRSVVTMTQALQGKVAGFNISTPSQGGAPGITQNLNIRGYTGLGTTGGPLIIIDGVQQTGSLSDLNMDDVENISVLKDAASAAIYGSSAPYGVVIVTTKKGRAGKPVITYNNNFAYGQPINLPHFVNSVEFAETYNEVFANQNQSPMFSEEVIQRMKDYQAGTFKDETIKSTTSDDWYAWDMSNANNDWFKVFFKDFSLSQQHNVGVSGASETSNYYIGLGYTQQGGMYNWAEDYYRRYNARANLSTNLTKWLTFNGRTSFARAQTDTPTLYGGFTGGGNFSRAYLHQIGRTWPTVPVKNPDGDYSEASGIKAFTDGGRTKTVYDYLTLTGEFVVNPLPGWDITGNYTYSGAYIHYTDHQKTFYQMKPSGATYARGGTTPNSFTREMIKNQRFNINAFTSYEKTIANGHYFKVLLGYTQDLIDDMDMWGSNNNLYSDALPSLTLTYGTAVTARDLAEQLATRGTFGRIAYNYQEKYLLELNGRYDGSSRFLEDVRYRFYPGVSVGWALSKESFWKPVEPYVNQFKLRASYASLGDHAFTDSRYPFYPALGLASPTGTNWLFSGGRESAFWAPGIVNYDLTWITVKTLDFGFDLSALDYRLNLSFDWYKRNSTDFVGPGEALPAILGVGAPQVNDAAIETKGFELTLGWKDRRGDFSYGIDFVLSDYQGVVTKYSANPNKLINNWYSGRKQGEIWGWETEGLFKDQAEIDATDQSLLNANWYIGDVHYKDLDGDGKLTRGDGTVDNPGDQRVIGNTTPRFAYGLTLDAGWKGFDAAVFLQGIGKRDIMFGNNAIYFWGLAASEWQGTYYTVHTDRWTENNPDGYYPRAYFNTTKNRESQTRYLQDASYLRIKNVQLGYSLPKSIINAINFQKARVFINIENLATFTPLMNIVDPEILDASQGNDQGKSYPLRRNWAFGINLTF
ncbi:MAG: TonB-dependent receptor [Tannerella sp.]|nr:TonB-dependent receptor [Tannerella sp.]